MVDTFVLSQPAAAPVASPRLRAAVEWPTVALAAVIFGGFVALTLTASSLPTLLVLPLAAWLIAWHSSLQHEIVHGHPTRWRAVNRAIGFVPLSLWIPFTRYRALHLTHHRDERLTDPLDDPESAYWTADDWARLDPASRVLVRAQATLLGRLVIGPAWCMVRFVISEARQIAAGDRVIAGVWGRHLAGCAVLLGYLWAICGIAPWTYLLVFVYPGTALLLVRSFAEHRAEVVSAHRTAVVEGSPVMGLLFLNNNLHAAHHAHPTLPWYRLPAWYRAHREELLAGNGGLVYRGYGDVVRRFLLRRHDRSVHPFGRAPMAGRQ